jgi:sugar lactone lactonase YvrE
MTAYHIVERPERDQLGETPFWDGETQTLFWCDIVGQEVRRLHPDTGEIERWPMPRPASGIVPTTDGHAVVMLTDGVYRIDFGGGGLAPFSRPDTDPRNRSNEVRTDPQGRLWLGSMGNNIGPQGQDVPQAQKDAGSIFCINGEGYAKRVLSDIGITNTFCWSPDGTRFYTADTSKRVIWSFAYDPEGPGLSDQQVFETGDEAPGNPDGASMDEEGCLWSARWGAGRLVRFTPQGKVDRVIELPAKQPSSCAFGGSDRKTLYITTARQGLDDLPPDSLDGALFVVEVDVAGLPMPRFRVS